MSPGRTRIENVELNSFGSADRAVAHELDRLEIDVLEMEAVGDHEADVMLARRCQHAFALFDRHRHRFLAEHVDTRFGSADRELGVHGVRERDVDGVDFVQAILELFIVEGQRHVVALLQGCELFVVIADERRQHRVLSRVGERGQDGDLRDMSKANDCVADRARWRFATHDEDLLCGRLHHDLDAAVLFLPEGSIHLGRVVEDHPMGDDKGRVDFASLDALEERRQVLVDVRLTHLERQALRESGAERKLVEPAAVDARNRYHATLSTGIDRLAECVGAIRRQIHRRLGAIVPGVKRGAMRLEADRIDAGVRALTAGQRSERVGHVDFLVVEDLGLALRCRHRQPLREHDRSR